MKFSKSVFKSIFGSTLLKLLSSIIAFISVPILIQTLGTHDYAVWVTITALVGWINLFDFGSGYSLKNKITEALATNKKHELQIIIAGTFQFYFIMTLTILFCFFGALIFVKVLNTHLNLALIVYLPIILSFPFTLGHFVLQGFKKFNLFNIILLTQSAVWLLLIILFKNRYLPFNIYYLAWGYSILFLIANFSILIFSFKNIEFERRSLFNMENFISSKSSLLVGTKFFLLQLSSLFLYSLGNVLTYNHLNLLEVTRYDTVNKVFTMGMTIFNVIISVYWTEISHEKALNNKDNLLKLYKQLIMIAAFFSLGCIVITYLMPFGIKFWTKNMVQIHLNKIFPFCILIIVQVFAYSGAVFLNAFEYLKGQIVFSFIGTLLIIPLANFLFNLSLGIGSVPLAAAILTFPTMVFVLFKARTCIKTLV